MEFNCIDYNKEKNVKSCSTCSKFQTVGAFVVGNSNFKFETFKIHAKCEDQMRLLSKQEALNSDSTCTAANVLEYKGLLENVRGL